MSIQCDTISPLVISEGRSSLAIQRFPLFRREEWMMIGIIWKNHKVTSAEQQLRKAMLDIGIKGSCFWLACQKPSHFLNWDVRETAAYMEKVFGIYFENGCAVTIIVWRLQLLVSMSSLSWVTCVFYLDLTAGIWWRGSSLLLKQRPCVVTLFPMISLHQLYYWSWKKKLVYFLQTLLYAL